MNGIRLLCGVLGILCGCFSLRAQTAASWGMSADDGRCRQWVDSVISGLGVQEKVGQLLVATIPAKKSVKKQLHEWVDRYKIGGLLFSEGTPEEQALLTNQVQKSARIPVMVTYDGEWGWSGRLKGVPEYPCNAALGCMKAQGLLEKYHREVARWYRELGIHVGLESEAAVELNPLVPMMKVRFFRWSQGEPRLKGMVFADTCNGAEKEELSQEVDQTLLGENDMLLVQSGLKETVQELLEAVRTGRLSQEALDAKCRNVLIHKYRLGLRNPQPNLQVSKMSARICTPEAQELAAELRRSAVTVVSNYFNILPLPPETENLALLSIGKKGADAAFVESMKANVPVSHFYLPWDADEAVRQEVFGRLAAFRRVVISVADSYITRQNAALLEELDVRAPLVYAVFAPCRMLRPLAPVLAKSSAVVLAHSLENDLQRYVADVLFAKQPAAGKLSMDIGDGFPAGTGCVIEPGMKPGGYIPEDYGLKSYVLQRVDGVARKGVEAGAYPGCRVLVWKDGKPMYDKGFGVHSDKDSTAVRPTDLFDLAALTKTTATLLAVMKLYDEGKIRLDDKVANYLPWLRDGDKRAITIRQLLFHEAGLPPYLRFYLEAIDPHSVHGPYSQSWVDQWHRTRVSEHSYYCSDFKFKKGMMADKSGSVHSLHVADGLWLNKSFKNTILQQIARCELEAGRYVYSDLSFVLLQQVVEAVTKLPMERYLEREFYGPMGLRRTLFLPLEKYPKTEIMPTASNDFLRRQDLCGYVHDETAACMGGVAGNAGLFSTAEEVAKVYQMLLDGGEWNGKRLLSEATCRLFTTEKSAISRRGLGFDKPDMSSAKLSPCAVSAPATVYGHTGFTGTCAWVDPTNKMVYVFLSNRLCPDVWNTKLVDMNICADIQELIYQSML